MWEGGREWHNNGQGKEEEEGLTWPTGRPPGPSPDVWVSRPTLPSPKPRTRTPSRTSPKPPTAKCRVRKIYHSWVTLNIEPQIFCRSLPNPYYLIFVIFLNNRNMRPINFSLCNLLKKLFCDKTVCKILHKVSNFTHTVCQAVFFAFQLENLRLWWLWQNLFDKYQVWSNLLVGDRKSKVEWCWKN